MYVRMENVVLNREGKEYGDKIGDFFAWAMDRMGLSVPCLDYDGSKYRFYWTEAGYDKFMSVASGNIAKNSIRIRQYKKSNLANIVYSDEYQVVVKLN